MWEKEVSMKRFSLFLSYAFCIAGFIAMLAVAFALPVFGIERLATVEHAMQHRFPVYLICYAIILLVVLADVCLFLLLQNTRRGNIFSKSSVRLLRVISWASIFAGFLAFPLYFFFLRSAIFVSFVGVFLGVVLRVVKQVIEKATELKEENDATI